MGIVVRLLYESKLLSLRLIETAFDRISFLQLFKGQNQQLCVVLVRQRPIREAYKGQAPRKRNRGGSRERYGREFPAF